MWVFDLCATLERCGLLLFAITRVAAARSALALPAVRKLIFNSWPNACATLYKDTLERALGTCPEGWDSTF